MKPVEEYLFAVCSSADESSLWGVSWQPKTHTLEATPSQVFHESTFALTVHPAGSPVYSVPLGDNPVILVSEVAKAPTGLEFAVRQQVTLPSVSFPCRVRINNEGTELLVAGYGNGTVGRLQVDSAGLIEDAFEVLHCVGSGPDTDRQDASHLHDVLFIDDEIIGVDLGSDVLRRFTAGEQGLSEVGTVPTPPGSGPRHIASFGADQLVVSGELNSTCMLFARKGIQYELLAMEPASYQDTAERNYPSAVVVHPEFGIAYIANRGADTITAYRITHDSLEFLAEVPSGGVRPEHCVVTSEYLLVAHSGLPNSQGSITVIELMQGVPQRVVARTEVPHATWIDQLNR